MNETESLDPSRRLDEDSALAQSLEPALELLLIVLAALVVWAAVIYNRLVRDRHRMLEAWSDIDVQLKRRHDLIPKLIEVVKRYAAYEQATLAAVTELRARSSAIESPAQKGLIEGELGAGLRQLIAVAERYPELKASEHFLSLQQDLTDLEDNIQYARRYYNGAVRNFNTRIQSVPDLIVARVLGYATTEYFQLDEENEREAPAF